MCNDGCTDHGQCVYIEPGQAFATWPSSDTATTQAVMEALADRGIVRGQD
jgi:hypothetical protein